MQLDTPSDSFIVIHEESQTPWYLKVAVVGTITAILWLLIIRAFLFVGTF